LAGEFISFATRADGRILQAFGPLRIATLLHPERHGCVQPGGTGGIEIHIGGDARAGAASGLDTLDGPVELVPVVPAGNLQVIDLGRCTGLAGYADGLVDGLVQTVCFAAHVHDIHAAALRGLAGHRREFLGARETEWGVDQRRGKPQRTLLHRLVDAQFHLLELLCIRLHVFFAEFVHADGTGADERRHVGRDATHHQFFEILAERGPVELDGGVHLPLHVCLHGLVERPHRQFAEDLERDALSQIAQGPAIDEQRFERMRQHVDEAGCHGFAARVELHRPLARGGRPDVDDAVSLQGHIADERLAATAVVDGSMPNDG